MSYESIRKEVEDRMDKALKHLHDMLRTVRTGQASPALVENVRVDYYGAPTPISQLGSISIPEPRQIVIKPFDASAIANVEKAIRTSNLGLNPQSDGKVIRLIIPPLSEERRKQLVKVVRDLGEQTNVSIRNVRRDANKSAETAYADRTMTEDQTADAKEQVQELTKTYEGKVKDLVDKKSAELME